MRSRNAGYYFTGRAPKDFVVAVGVEGRINVNQIHAGVGQLGELFQIVAAVDDAGVEEGGGAGGGLRSAGFIPLHRARGWGRWSGGTAALHGLSVSLFRHARRLDNCDGGVNSADAKATMVSSGLPMTPDFCLICACLTSKLLIGPPVFPASACTAGTGST